MSILEDIRSAVQAYLNSSVQVSISQVTAPGGLINPNEEFTFTVSAKNIGGISLKNVRYYVGVKNPSVVKLKVPADPWKASYHLSPSIIITPEPKAGDYVNFMYLFPPVPPSQFPFLPNQSYLAAGETENITLTGKADSNPQGGQTSIQFQIFADIDVDSLLPKNEDSSLIAKTINVWG